MPRQVNYQLCGFSGSPSTAWSPNDLKQMLELHREQGPKDESPHRKQAGFHSGYVS